jgi:hypothetical protein
MLQGDTEVNTFILHFDGALPDSGRSRFVPTRGPKNMVLTPPVARPIAQV